MALAIAIGAGAVVAGVGSYFAYEAQKDAAKSNKEISEMTLQQQKELYGDAKAEILQNNKDLITFADQAGIDIKNALDTSNAQAFQNIMNSLNNAKNAQLEGNTAAAQDLIAGVQEAQGYFTPWMESGQWANQQLVDRADELTRQFTLEDFQVDPGYQFRLGEGQKAIINKASALGIGGNTMKDIINYSQDVASSEYGKAYGRFTDWQRGATDYYNQIASRGFAATGSMAQLAQQKGEIGATEDINRANILSGYATDVGKTISDKYKRQGDIAANYFGDRQDIRERTTTRENQALTGLAGGNVAALSKYSGAAREANTQQGQAGANFAANLANTGTNLLSNYLFYRYSQPNQMTQQATQPVVQPQPNYFYDPYYNRAGQEYT